MVGPLLDRALRQLQQFRPIDLEDPDLRLQATMQGLGNLADQLATLPGRKSIVWITHGVPIDNTWYADAYAADISRICFQLVSDKIPVYAVHESDELGIHIDSGSFLEQFTGLTGGIMFGSDRTEEAISQAIKDSRFSYSLSYRPEHLTWDGKFHKLRVKSTRPGIRLRTLQGYYAIPPPPQ
jgi:VWFA-related protein